MSIPATITIDLADRTAIAQLAAVMLALAATAEKSPAMTFTPPSAPADPKPRRTKAAKDDNGNPVTTPAADAPKPEEKPATPTTEPVQETIPGVAPTTTQPQPSSPDELRAALLAVIQNPKLGPPKAGEILTKHGAKNASAVPVEKRGLVIADLKAALEGAK